MLMSVLCKNHHTCDRCKDIAAEIITEIRCSKIIQNEGNILKDGLYVISMGQMRLEID